MASPRNRQIRLVGLILLAGLLAPAAGQSADWLHWRGPEQNGLSREVSIPATFDLTKEGSNGLIWKKPFGGRSAPLVLNGKLYFMNGYDTAKLTEGERVVCLDATTGNLEWEYRFGVFHTDIVSSRLGWTSMTADPEAGIVYAHTTAGHLFALNAKDGKLVWQRQLTEEFGRVTGYGGRIASPIFDSGLVILGLVNGSWGDQARGNHRFVAFDSKTGAVVWWSSPTESLNQATVGLRGTYYSNPVIAVVNGQRLLISGGADGCAHALKLRTGERAWSFQFSAGVVNPSPVVDGNLVYMCHGEENPGGGSIGRVLCLDMSEVKGGKPKVVWDNKNLARRFGLASPALADGKLYIPEDGGELYCFEAKTGKSLWKYKYGTVARGAPLVCNGYLYIFDVLGKLSVIKLGNKEPDHDDDVQEFRFKPRSGTGQLETNGTPIAVNGRLYLQTLDDTYCIGDAKAPAPAPMYKPLAEETKQAPDAAAAEVMIFPADVVAKPGETITFSAQFVDANGRLLSVKQPVVWSLPLPPKTPAGAQPPALAGEIAQGVLKLAPNPGQQGYVEVVAGNLKARARVRVAAQLPLKQDFSKVPVGATPGGWVNTQGKYAVAEVEIAGKKEKVLSKINTDPRPPIARANAYMTSPGASNYTVQAEMYGGEVGGKLPDMGVVAHRYLLILDGKIDPDQGQRQLRIVSWEARNRVVKSMNLAWKKETWYTVKFSIQTTAGQAKIQGKVWERGKDEPADWMIEFTDPNPNLEGAAGLYGYVSNVTDGENGITPGSPIYYQNVSVTPNDKK
jgi:outer membrane protein assembly factor BamB